MKKLPALAQADLVKTFDDWSIAAIPSSVLTVYDLSASMGKDLGGTSRIDVAVNAGLLSLDVLPGYTRIGMWSFSSRKDESQAWTEIAPLRRIDQRVDGRTQSDLLRTQAESLKDKVRGGTKLFDTVEASYRQAIEDYDPAYNNSVVFFTDGGADDSSTIDLAELIERLKKLRDPERPVHFVMIGISEESDSAVMQSIAQATGGSSFVVNQADDMIPVLASALLG